MTDSDFYWLSWAEDHLPRWLFSLTCFAILFLMIIKVFATGDFMWMWVAKGERLITYHDGKGFVSEWSNWT